VLRFVPLLNKEHRVHVFDLWLSHDFRLHELRMPHPSFIKYMLGEHVRQVERSEGDPSDASVLHFIPTDAWNIPKLDHHPFNVLTKLFENGVFTDLSEEIMDFVCHRVLMANNQSALDEQARQDLAGTLSELTKGWVDAQYVIDPGGEDLMECGSRGSLLRLTCVFPWAIDVLLRRPNCLMTDSTFKALAPYTLPILHAVFANESIPIAFGMSPTETAAAYENMYSAIEGLYNQVVHGVQAPICLPDAPLKRVEGSEEWSGPGLDNSEEALTGEMVPPRWEEEVPVIDDAITVHEDLVLPEGRDFLQSIPIVTDQGGALKLFIGRRQLHWKICHRHIIEAIGAGSRLGHWATRILNCYSLEEWQRTVAVVMEEMILQRDQYSTDPPGYRSLLRLMGIVERDDDHCLASQEHWALWLRKGCPRTTNSAESVNGHLNQELKAMKHYPPLSQRIAMVADHFIKRYSSRNAWCDRALTRNAHNCFPSDRTKARSWYSAARVEFYQTLHNATGLSGPVRRKFSPEDRRCIFPHFAQNRYIQTISEDAISQPNDDVGPPAASDRSSISLHQEACENYRAYVAWQIAHSMSKSMGAKRWRLWSTEIVHNIISIAISLGLSETGPWSIRQQAVWRSQCLKMGSDLCGPIEQIAPVEPIDDDASSEPEQIGAAAERFREFLEQQGTSRRAKRTSSSTDRPAPHKRPKPRNAGARRTVNPKAVGSPRGLFNERFTCYLNAVVQALAHLPSLSLYFASESVQRAISQSTTCNVASAYCSLQKLLLTPSAETLNPLSLRGAMDPALVRWPPAGQHDPSDFLIDLLEALDNELKSLHPVNGGGTIVSHLFTGHMEQHTQCKQCGLQFHMSDPFWVLPLQLSGPDGSETSPPETLTLDHCFSWLRAEHPQGEDNNPTCDICSVRCEHAHTVRLLDLPPVLVLQLGRFVKESKITTHVVFPLHLNVAPYLPENTPAKRCQYLLSSVIKHNGPCAQSGHFVAYIRKGLVWFLCDDGRVRPFRGNVMEVEAYLLFYERVEIP
jgi:ubiquitin C-terminal hydrolase